MKKHWRKVESSIMLAMLVDGDQGRRAEVGRHGGGETMEPDRLNDEILSRVEINRRELVRRLVIGTAFAVPVVSSFDMAALTTSSANALTPNQLGFGGSNQTFGRRPSPAPPRRPSSPVITAAST